MKTWFTIAACLTAAAAAAPVQCALGQDAAPSIAAPDGAICSMDDGGVARFRAGDRITLTEYERIDPDQLDRMPAKNAYPSYRLRAEVSGDFEIAEDGTISVPILGQFKAAGKSVEELRSAIGAAFEATLGHVGVITIAIAEHQPIYVDGLVKSPGAYKYTPGLTAQHAVSLAGGYEDIKLESHQVLFQTMQEAGTGEQAKQTLERLLARDAVLRAELAAVPASTPATLIDLSGENRARELVAAQIAERETVLASNAAQQQQQTQIMDSAKQTLNVRKSQVETIDAAIERRRQRVKNLEALTSSGRLSEAVFEIAQAEYLDSLLKKQEVAVGIQQAQMQISDAQANLTRLKLDARFALQHEISDLELQIAQQGIVYRSHLATVSLIDANPNTPGAAPLTYNLVRRTGGRVAIYRVYGSCLLQPGDLVRVFAGEGGASEYLTRSGGDRDRRKDDRRDADQRVEMKGASGESPAAREILSAKAADR
jgi:polysaccharide biosynthesis/export protein ExoF